MRLFYLNIKHVFRSLKKNAVLSLLTIFGLTIGLTVFSLSTLFVINEKTVNHNIPNYNRIYRFYELGNKDCGLDYKLENDIKNYTDVEANCVFLRFEMPIVLQANKKFVKLTYGISTSNRFFEVFDFPIINKISEQPFAEKKSIILTKSVAHKLFGSKNPIGETVNFNNMFELKITGIVNDFPENTSINTDYLINAEDEKMRMATVCNSNDCYDPMSHYVLLKKGIDINGFIDHFNKTIGQYQSRVDSFGIQKLDDIYLSENKESNGNRKGNISFIRLISIIGLIILILAILNYLNFSLSLQHSKIREISIRKINGAGVIQLFFYYLAESLIIIAFAVVLSFLTIGLFNNSFAQIFGDKLNLQIFKSPYFILINLGVLLIVLLINSIIPAYSLIKLNVISGLNNKIKQNDTSNIKTIFTIVQFIASIVLLISVLFINKQLNFVQTKYLGFERQNLLKIDIPWGYKEFTSLKAGIDNLSFVESSSFSSGNPGNINLGYGNGDAENEIMFKAILVDSNFLRTFQIKLIEGRTFLGGDFHKSCIINETGMKKSGWKNLHNKRFNNGSKEGYDVIGVVKDFNVTSLHNKQEPVCLFFDNTNQTNCLSVRIIPGVINEQIKQLKQVWESLSDNPFDIQFYDTLFDSKYKKELQLSKSITILAIIAIFLTLIGILGQVIQTCIYRTKEIGIRKVNGASVLEIIKMINIDFVKWVLIAFIVSVPIAYYSINKWLGNFAYQTSMNWWVFALAGLIILIVVIITVSWQTYKVASQNPIEALRYE